MHIEDDLKRALRRESPAPGFADRVLKRLATSEHRPRPIWWRAAAASVALTILGGSYAAHEYAEYRRGIRARDQVLLALQIAGEKVRYAQQEVREIGNQENP